VTKKLDICSSIPQEKYMTQHLPYFLQHERVLGQELPQVKVNLFLPLTKHHDIKDYWESGGIDQRILNLGTRWR
jgi:hypothetical protein